MYQLLILIENVLLFQRNRTGIAALILSDKDKTLLKIALSSSFEENKVYEAAGTDIDTLQEADELFQIGTRVNKLREIQAKGVKFTNRKMVFPPKKGD